MLPESLLTGANAAWLDDAWHRWLRDPDSVDPELAAHFEGLERPTNGGPVPGSAPRHRPPSIFAGSTDTAADGLASARLQTRVAQLINAYRVRGHMAAHIDPLGRRDVVNHPELTLDYYGIPESDLDTVVPTNPMYGMPETATLRQIIERCRAAYCSSIGAEFMNINVLEQKQWVLQQLETLPDRHVLSRNEEMHIYRRLCDAENFERMLHTRFPGTKRFSLERGETLVPLLDLVMSEAGRQGITECVFGMAHRGRLNTLVNVLEKPAHIVVEEFQDVQGPTQGSGDVKYHKGYSADIVTVHGDTMHLSLTPNPSHLEAVDPIVLGRARAKQDRLGRKRNESGRAGNPDRRRVMPILLHGDAAFAGQGLVCETLNLSELSGFKVGGTLHVVVNNQIGFTTPTEKARSTPYDTDVARMLGIPILHVNGEDPRAVAACVELAVTWRQRYRRDVIIDMYCYRLHGHNEGDEPSFTQPLMYDVIRNRPSPRANYAERLVRLGDLSQEDVDRIYQESYDSLLETSEPKAKGPERSEARSHTQHADEKGDDPDLDVYFSIDADDQDVTEANSVDRDEVRSAFKGLWFRYTGGDADELADTTFDRAELQKMLVAVNSIPKGFAAHRKIVRLSKQRLQIARGTRPVDWAMAEQSAFATLLSEGYSVRLSGQDCGRGTFSHRHAVITDTDTGANHFSLDAIPTKGRFYVNDSMLSEAGVLGFEVGYAMDTPDGLVMWEAQFGDFANGAQVIIDQFIVSSETKWSRYMGVVLMLPHGFEGQGPEHSSARLERYLVACAEENIQVCNVTSPANYFHMLRRQVARRVRKPLVVMTPKSLLRHPEAVSSLDELADGTFQTVIPETDDFDDGAVRRVVLVSGKLYYELRAMRRTAEEKRVAIVRVEQLYPFPADALKDQLTRYPGADVVWCQEEPRNMGAWPVIRHWFLDELGIDPTYVGRPAAASPATGSHKKHREEQHALSTTALTL